MSPWFITPTLHTYLHDSMSSSMTNLPQSAVTHLCLWKTFIKTCVTRLNGPIQMILLRAKTSIISTHIGNMNSHQKTLLGSEGENKSKFPQWQATIDVNRIKLNSISCLINWVIRWILIAAKLEANKLTSWWIKLCSHARILKRIQISGREAFESTWPCTPHVPPCHVFFPLCVCTNYFILTRKNNCSRGTRISFPFILILPWVIVTTHKIVIHHDMSWNTSLSSLLYIIWL